MRILVCVKHLPDFRGVRRFNSDNLVDRDAATGILNEVDEHSLEQAVRLRETWGGSIAVLCIGSARARVAVEKSLQYGADHGYLLTDNALRGSDALTTSAVLAAAVHTLEMREGSSFDLILAALTATDSYMGVQPIMLAERLGRAVLAFATTLDVVDGGPAVRITRDIDGGLEELEASFPAVVSVTDQAPPARHITIRDIVRARTKPLETMTLHDIDMDRTTVGAGAAAAVAIGSRIKEAKTKGRVISDDGAGSSARELVEFLRSRTAQR